MHLNANFLTSFPIINSTCWQNNMTKQKKHCPADFSQPNVEKRPNWDLKMPLLSTLTWSTRLFRHWKQQLPPRLTSSFIKTQTTRDAVLCTLSFRYQRIQFPVLKQQKCHEMQHSLTLLRTNSTKDSFKRSMCCSHDETVIHLVVKKYTYIKKRQKYNWSVDESVNYILLHYFI